MSLPNDLVNDDEPTKTIETESLLKTDISKKLNNNRSHEEDDENLYYVTNQTTNVLLMKTCSQQLGK